MEEVIIEEPHHETLVMLCSQYITYHNDQNHTLIRDLFSRNMVNVSGIHSSN